MSRVRGEVINPWNLDALQEIEFGSRVPSDGRHAGAGVDVTWFLSTNRANLPNACRQKGTHTHRLITLLSQQRLRHAAGVGPEASG